MKTVDQLTPQDLARSLRSTICPTCTGSKAARKTLCTCCFFELPDAIQGRLYRRIGQGYEKAFTDAMDHLKVSRPTMPTDA